MRPKQSNHRNTYQNQLLYTSIDATGYHFANSKEDPVGSLRNLNHFEQNGNQVRQLHRIQNIDYGFNINRVNINTFGQAARVDSATLETPDVFLNFEYLLADGYNEGVCGFVTDGKAQCISKHLMRHMDLGQNFFLLVGPDGHDIIGKPLDSIDSDLYSVVGLGNCFLNQYAVTASIGELPRARLSYEAYNVRSYKGFQNLPIPSVNMYENIICPDIKFSIPDTFESFTYPKLIGLNDIAFENSSRGITPSSIRMHIGEPTLISQQIGSDGIFRDGDALIQGFSINVPLANTRLKTLGKKYEIARLPKYPSLITIKINAILSELKKNVSLYDMLCDKNKHDLKITMHDPCALEACDNRLLQQDAQIVFELKGAVLVSEGLEHSVNDPHRLVELEFNCQISGPEDNKSGLFIYGKSFFPDFPKILAWGHPLI